MVDNSVGTRVVTTAAKMVAHSVDRMVVRMVASTVAVMAAS